MMSTYHDPDGDWCCRALHTAHAVFHDADGKLIARAQAADGEAICAFEITGFELI